MATMNETFFDALLSPKAAKWSAGVAFDRSNPLPLDQWSVFRDLASATDYLSNAKAYPGQVIAYAEANGEMTVCVLSQNPDGSALTLKPVGTVPVGDNKSVEIIDEKIALHDFGKAFYKYFPEEKNEETGEVTKEAYYSKVEVSESNPWKAGLEPKVVTEGSALVIGWYEPNPTTIEGVNDQVTAVQGTVADLEQSVGVPSAEGQEATGLYKEIEDVQEDIENLTSEVGTSEDKLGDNVNTLWANVNDLDSRLDAVESKEDKDTTYSVASGEKVLKLVGTELATELSIKYADNRISLTGINGEEIAGFDASVFIEEGVLQDVDYKEETRELIFTWNIVTGTDDEGNFTYKTDVVSIADLVDTYTAGNGLALDSNSFSVKIAEGSESFLSVDANGLKLSGIQSAIDSAKDAAIGTAASDAESKANAAKQAAIDDAAGKYATTGALTQLETNLDNRLDVLEAIDHTQYATKTELKATDDVAKDAQSRVDIVEGKIDEITSVGGEPNVVEKIKVNGVTLEVEKDDEGKSTKSVNISVPTKFSDIEDDSGFDARITAAQNKANEAGTAASNAQASADANAQNIQTNANAITNLQTLTGEHTTKIAALEQANTTHAAEFAALNETVTTHGTDIAGLKTGKADTTVTDSLAGRITTNENAIKTINDTLLPAKANAADVYSKTEIGTITEGKTLVEMIAEAKSEATYDDTEVRNLITGNTNAIATIYKVDGETKSGVLVDEIARVEGLISSETGRAQGVESGLNTRLETVEAFWKEAIRDSDEKNVIDTLKEIQEYIESDESGASAMAASIKANADAIAAIYTPASGEGEETVPASGVLVIEIARLDKAIADNSTADKKYTDDAIAALQQSIHGVDDKTIKLNENKAYVAEVSTDILVQGATELVFCAGHASGYHTTH